MRVLFFLEPVIFHLTPDFLSCHFIWTDLARRATTGRGDVFALAANTEVCERWRALRGGGESDRDCFPLDSFKVLSTFDHKRADYSKALYGAGDSANYLTRELVQIRREFRPDLVMATSQSSFLRHVFSDVPILSVEQAPLPRLGQPFRTAYDPGGHQTGSMLETHAQRIKSLPLPAGDSLRLQELLASTYRRSLEIHPHLADAEAELDKARQGAKVAILATQPPDWVTYEGAGTGAEVENMLYEWAQRLPEGWVGVPTYHPVHRLSVEMETVLARSCPRLRFLPQAFTQGLTEPLLAHAEGLVTLSSSSAMTALLLGKRVVVTGRSPFNAWCIDDPAGIADAPVLNAREAMSTLAFLSSRYSHLHDAHVADPDKLYELMRAVASLSDPAEWFMDMSEWSVERASLLFEAQQPVCLR
ncbi:hypothetical protein WN982_30755 [Paraburkholderia sp. IMGN_8]|uniref:capsular polysaccharide export protein, LipB/KpsS family n=1 Tax=Paraburkholderia sp. IMGN_8 TaxID=3136564 RepID=UPI003100FF66